MQSPHKGFLLALLLMSALLPMPLHGQDKYTSALQDPEEEAIAGFFTSWYIDFLPDGDPMAIEIVDSMLNAISQTSCINDSLRMKWLWKGADACFKTNRITMMKPYLDSIASAYKMSDEPDYSRLFHYYAFYYLYTGHRGETYRYVKSSLDYANTLEQRLIALKTLRDMSLYTDPTGEETVSWCMKLEPYLKTKEYSGEYISNIDVCFLSGGDSLDLLNKTKAFLEWTEFEDEKAEAELELWNLTGLQDTSYLHNVINNYERHRMMRMMQGNKDSLLFAVKDMSYFSHYLSALSEMMWYLNEYDPKQALKTSLKIIDIFEHPDTTGFYTKLHEETTVGSNHPIHEFYIPALMHAFLSYIDLSRESGDYSEYFPLEVNILQKLCATYKKDFEHLLYYIEEMPDYDIRKYIDNYYLSIHHMYPCFLYSSNRIPEIQLVYKEFLPVLLFYKGLILRKNKAIPNEYKNIGLFTFDYVRTLLDKYSGNAYFIDFTYTEEEQRYMMSIIGKEYDTPIAAFTDPLPAAELNSLEIYDNGTVYNKIWKKISDICPEGSLIFFVPDNVLYRTNIEMLPDDNGTPASEKYRLYRLSSFLEMEHGQKNRRLNSAAIFGTSAPDLKASASEIKTTHEILRLNGTDAVLYEREDATKSAFLKLSGHSPDIIHFSAHGFYKNEDELQRSVFFQDNYSGPDYYDFSMINSGLIMSNEHSDSSSVLLSEEIASMSLDSTGLVVLASCKSGLGDTSYDGVLGLQRAFKTAGAQTIIMTLWDISDNAAYLFTTSFYSHLVKSKDIRKSFITAVNTVKEKFHDPYYWAAFIMLD